MVAPRIWFEERCRGTGFVQKIMKKQHIFEFAKGGKSTARATVGFRMDDERYGELSERAKNLGVSPHELARQYVIEVLSEGEERTALREAVNALIEHVREARKDIGLSTEALLASAGTLDEKEARDWKQKNLFTE
jgi:hypothetical protein